jgi:L-ascorbate metabolism protein UlaG (beta-lactamase superfamily)
MKLSKYIHSCLLVEEAGEQLLFDPGKFTFLEGRVSPQQFARVRWIVFTHAHPDHIDFNVMREIVKLSGATVLGNSEVRSALAQAGTSVEQFDEGERDYGAFHLQAVPARHQPILSEKLPVNTGFVVNRRLLNGGDSFHGSLEIFRGTKILALPVLAPYLTELQVMDYVTRMQPKHAIPLHDGYARDFFIRQRYDNYQPYFQKLGVTLHQLVLPGDSVEL